MGRIFFNVMKSLACQRAPHPACIVVWFSPFLPPRNMLERAVSLVSTGDQSEVSSHLQWGFFSLCTALYCDWSAWLWRLLHKEELTSDKEDTSERTLSVFLSVLVSCV